MALRWRATCTDCDWTYENTVRSDVDTHARRHRSRCPGPRLADQLFADAEETP